MSRTPNEQRLLDLAGRVDGLAGQFREGLNSLRERITELESQAKSPQAHEVEDLSEEFKALEESLAQFEQIGGTLRAGATQGGNIPAQAGDPNAPAKPMPGEAATLANPPTQESGPGGQPTTPLVGQTYKTTLDGSQLTAGQSSESGDSPTPEGVLVTDGPSEGGGEVGDVPPPQEGTIGPPEDGEVPPPSPGSQGVTPLPGAPDVSDVQPKPSEPTVEAPGQGSKGDGSGGAGA